MPVRLLRRLTVTALSGRHSVARREATKPGCRAAAASQRQKEKGGYPTEKRPPSRPEAGAKRQAKDKKNEMHAEENGRRKQRRRNEISRLRGKQSAKGQTRQGQRGEGTDGRECVRGRGREKITKKAPALEAAGAFRAIFGSGLLSHMTLCSIISDGELNYRVRNGVGCTLSSMATKEILSNIITRDGRNFSRKQDARAISTGQLHASRRFHLQPIDEVVYLGPSGLASGRTYLKAGFPLRCFQRLSLPHIATLLCRWHDNRSTSGVSIPVLSY